MESSQLNSILIGVIVGLLFYTLLMNPIKETMASLNETEGLVKVDTNTCSRDCCRHSQWPIPFQGKRSESENIGTNLMCNGGNGGGCVCMTENDYGYISGRAGNLVSNQ